MEISSQKAKFSLFLFFFFFAFILLSAQLVHGWYICFRCLDLFISLSLSLPLYNLTGEEISELILSSLFAKWPFNSTVTMKCNIRKYEGKTHYKSCHQFRISKGIDHTAHKFLWYFYRQSNNFQIKIEVSIPSPHLPSSSIIILPKSTIYFLFFIFIYFLSRWSILCWSIHRFCVLSYLSGIFSRSQLQSF